MDAVRFGTTPKGAQRFLCKRCGRTFFNNGAPCRMRFDAEIISNAIGRFYESEPLTRIQRSLEIQFSGAPHVANIHRWILRYTKTAVEALEAVPINVGSVWQVDEVPMKLKWNRGGTVWSWAVRDQRTRFLLGAHISERPSAADARELMEKAVIRAGMIPGVLHVPHRLFSFYRDSDRWFRLAPDEEGPGLLVVPTERANTEKRPKVRPLTDRPTTELTTRGWLVHYNFFRPHAALGGRTPAEMADAGRVTVRSWKDVVTSSSLSLST